MPDIPLKSNSSITTEYHCNVMASGHRESNGVLCFWQIKNNTLAGSFGFVGNKMAFTIGKLTEFQSHFITYKSNSNTSYLNTKLIKQLT